MATTTSAPASRSLSRRQVAVPGTAHEAAVVTETSDSRVFDRAMAILRYAMAWVFLWPFLDKTFGLGFATAKEAAWIRGGSPTEGFLRFGTSGPFADAFQGLAGQVWVDILFMIGLLLIGASLALGIGLRIAAGSGILLLGLMWLAALPPEHNPFLDDHLVYGIALAALALGKAGDTWGLGRHWSGLKGVKRYGFLH